MNNSINIAYTFNENEYVSLIISMLSVLENNAKNQINFYIASDDKQISNNVIQYINSLKRYKNCKSINFIKIDKKKYEPLKSRVILEHNIYAFELPYLIDADKIIYLNPYTFVTADLSELFNIDMSDFAVAACEYPYIPYHKSINGVYYLSNVLLINSKKWREGKYFEEFISKSFLKKDDLEEPLCPSACFAYLIPECKMLDAKYNYCELTHVPGIVLSSSKTTKNSYKSFLMHVKTPVIISFCGPKPVDDYTCIHTYKNLWWEYAEKSEIYPLIKEYRTKKRYKLSATSAQNSFKYTWLLSRIFPYIKPYWFRILLGFLIAIPLGLLDGVTALALKPYMDYVIGGKELVFSYHGFSLSISSIQMAFILPVGIILFAALQGVLRYLNGYFSQWVSARITNDVKFDLFHRLIHMHPQFYDDNSSGIVISRYMGDPGTASAGIVDNIKTITTSLCGALGLIAVMLYSSWKLAFIGVFVLCAAFIPVILIRKRIKEASNKNMVIGGNITTNINETYSGNKVMAAYGLQDRQENYFKEKVWDSYHIGMSLYKRAGWMSPLMYLIASFGIATVLGVGTYLINSGQMTAGAFASFTTSLLLLYKPIKTLGNTLTGIQNIFVAMGRVFELFDLDSAIKEKEDPIELQDLKENIRFENVNFEYTPNRPVLKDFNLSVQKGETLAIVGNSGGGKSTLVNLIPRFYDIKSGSIKIDGVDIREFSLSSLRRNVSMVFQDNFLFSGSIKENIMMGNPDATVDELNLAIQSAHLEDMINELPEGLDTMLGERGLTLSGGQRQRVAIARAMLKNAPIVILDEATSALDNESEAIVQKAMDNLMQNRTVFIIAHRLSTIKNADRIAVINEGELVELGTHNELINIENGHYRALYEMQFKKQENTAAV